MTAAPRIGVTEDKLLVFLCRYVRATLEQCTRYGHSRSSLGFVRKRLNRLIDHGYVDAYAGFSRDGRPPLIYSPTLKGWQYGEERHDLPTPQRWRPSEARIVDYRECLHDLAITDFGIALEQFCRQAEPDVRFVRFVHDRLLPQTKVRMPDGSEKARRLDGFAELHLLRGDPPRARQRCFLLEIDRGTHFQRALKEKIVNQVYYVKAGHYQADFGTSSLTYLWICPDDVERLRRLKQLFEATLAELDAREYGPLFALTPLNPAATDDLVGFFTGPYWLAPFEPAPIALLAAPRPQTAVRLEKSQFIPQEQYDRFLTAIGETPSSVVAEQEME